MLIQEVTKPDTPVVGDILCLEFGSVVIESQIIQVQGDDITVALNDCTDFLRENFDGAESIDHFFSVLSEAEYRGRKVPLGKPMRGDIKKSKVYVKKPNGNVVKVEFGDPNMRIKKSNPKRRKSFRARHRCDNPGPRWKARYWSCRAW